MTPFAPTTSNPASALDGALTKVRKGQTERVTINLNRPGVTLKVDDIDAAVRDANFGDYDYAGPDGRTGRVKEINVISPAGEFIRLFKDE